MSTQPPKKNEKIHGILKSPWLVVVFSSVMALLSVVLTSPGIPKPALMWLIQNLARHEKIHCYDLGYTFLSSFFYRWAGMDGLFCEQAFNYVLIGVVSYLILRKILGHGSYGPALGACLVLIYPETWLNVHRVVETNLVILLSLAFLYFLLPPVQSGWALAQAVMIGFISAYMILSRPNLILVLPLLLVPMSKSIKNTLAAAAMGLGVLTIVPGLASGIFYPTPQEGKITFFHGANPHSKESLLKYYNAEPLAFSKDNLEEMKMDPSIVPQDSGMDVPSELFNQKVTRFSIHWIKTHPFEYLELIPIKFWTIVRPDFRYANNCTGWKYLVIALAQIAMALIFPFWLVCKWVFRDGFYGSIGAAPFSILYLIPFLLTNADPRYRIPLDALFLLETVVFAFRFLNDRVPAGAGKKIQEEK
jgi:hypothetical protein